MTVLIDLLGLYSECLKYLCVRLADYSVFGKHEKSLVPGRKFDFGKNLA